MHKPFQLHIGHFQLHVINILIMCNPFKLHKAIALWPWSPVNTKVLAYFSQWFLHISSYIHARVIKSGVLRSAWMIRTIFQKCYHAFVKWCKTICIRFAQLSASSIMMLELCCPSSSVQNTWHCFSYSISTVLWKQLPQTVWGGMFSYSVLQCCESACCTSDMFSYSDFTVLGMRYPKLHELACFLTAF